MTKDLHGLDAYFCYKWKIIAAAGEFQEHCENHTDIIGWQSNADDKIAVILGCLYYCWFAKTMAT